MMNNLTNGKYYSRTSWWCCRAKIQFKETDEMQNSDISRLMAKLCCCQIGWKKKCLDGEKKENKAREYRKLHRDAATPRS
jgi:hypothetical protein